MKPILTLIATTALLTSCNEKPSPEIENSLADFQTQSDTLENTSTENKVFLLDRDTTVFEILSGDNLANYEYKIVEINYEVSPHIRLPDELKHNDIFAKYTTTTEAYTSMEKKPRNIKVEIKPYNNPQKTILTIERNCDKIELDYDTYKTTTYGCCGGEDEFMIFDYKHNLIIEAEDKILLGSIPNSGGIKLYVGYKSHDDSLNLGSLTIAYNSIDKYIVRIKSDKDIYMQNIEIDTGNEKDEFRDYNNEYTFWSLNEIKNKDQVNGLVVKLSFGSSRLGYNTVEIPIINGKPFGKDIKNQEINLEYRNR